MRSRGTEKPKLVLDTSVLVAAVLSGSGASAEIIGRVLGRKAHNFYTDETIKEAEDVLARKRFSMEVETQEHFLHLLTEASFRVEPLRQFEAAKCRDAKDDKFLSLTVQTESDFLVSLDQDLLDLKHIGKAKIVRPDGLLASWQETSFPDWKTRLSQAKREAEEGKGTSLEEYRKRRQSRDKPN